MQMATVPNDFRRRLLSNSRNLDLEQLEYEDLNVAKAKQIQGPCLDRTVRPELIWQNKAGDSSSPQQAQVLKRIKDKVNF